MKPLNREKTNGLEGKKVKSDKRSRHQRARRRKEVQSGSTVDSGNRLVAGSSFKERMEQIPSLDLRDLHLIIEEAQDEQHIDIQEDVIKHCLKRILSVMKPGANRDPRHL